MPNLYSQAAKLPKSFTIGTDIFISKGEGFIVKLKQGRKTTKKKAGKSPAKPTKKAKTKGKKKANSARKARKSEEEHRNVYLGKKGRKAKAKASTKPKAAQSKPKKAKQGKPPAGKPAPVAKPMAKRANPVVSDEVSMVPQPMPVPALAPVVTAPTIHPDEPLPAPSAST